MGEQAILIRKQAVLEQLYDEEDKAVIYYFGVDDPWLLSMVLPLDDWYEMGKPKQLTITIELGDTLNAADRPDS